MSVVNFALSRVIVRGIAPQARDRLTPGHIHGALAMKTTEPQIPSEAIEAYNLYIHGEIDRRSFFDPRSPPRPWSMR
jgi:hypothetical protein